MLFAVAFLHTTVQVGGILGDPGADSRGEGKSKREEKYGTGKGKERREEPLGAMFHQTSSKRSPPSWLLIGARKHNIEQYCSLLLHNQNRCSINSCH